MTSPPVSSNSRGFGYSPSMHSVEKSTPSYSSGLGGAIYKSSDVRAHDCEGNEPLPCHQTDALLGEQNKNVTLPCSFKPGGNEVIHWTTGDKKNVHSYYGTMDQLQNQDKEYSGRTSLFPNEISKGNASLQIMGLKKSDENTYICYVSTNAGYMEDKMDLQVIDALFGEQNKNVILPCFFKPGGNEVIHWTTSNNKKVHSYYGTMDQLQNQDKEYSGRTSLFLNEISKGNASLHILGLKKSDENTYICYVSTNAGNMEDKMDLRVIDVQYTMEYKWDENGLLNVICSVLNASCSENISIKWYVNDQKFKEEQVTSSSYTVRSDSLKFRCTIECSIVQSSWTGTWTKKEPIIEKDDSVTCGCNFCKTANTDFYAKWHRRQETNEMTIASINNLKPNISTAYEKRIKINEKHNLNLPKLNANDNGIYICLIETEQLKTIEMTSVNITVHKGYAVSTEHTVLETASLPASRSAQEAELKALAQACHQATALTAAAYAPRHRS
ncbi:HERV-H LTR-associating protein 2 [Rhinoderma darwinii]|uniref:HERV-H LTR-associating protein 2 n=1 Tax=Rhinoderma darwinii TaxID=43563 RepID=UPI003F67EDE1